MDYKCIKTGTPWTFSSIPDHDGTRFELWPGGAFLLIFYNHPREEEILAVKNGQIKMGLYYKSPILFILFKIKGLIEYGDAPFSYRIYDNVPDRFDINAVFGPEEGMVVTLILVDRETGLVEALRPFGAGHEFSVEFCHKCWEQLQEPYSYDLYKGIVAKVYMDLSAEKLFKKAQHLFEVKGHDYELIQKNASCFEAFHDVKNHGQGNDG